MNTGKFSSQNSGSPQTSPANSDAKAARTKIDLTGKRFSRLVVCGEAPRKHPWVPVWRCLCDCGKTVNIPRNNLVSGNSRSCGCARPQRNLRGTVRRVISMRRHAARKRGFEWSLPTEDAVDLMLMDCFYCGAPPGNEMSKATHKGHLYGGIDRIDPSCGYTSENVRPACAACNTAKLDMTDAQFAAWCQRIIQRAWWLREDGKVVKPPGFVPADVAGVLARAK